MVFRSWGIQRTEFQIVLQADEHVPAYGMTFKALAPMLGLPENVLNALLEDLDKL